MYRIIVVVLLAVAAGGCTTYYYLGKIDGKNSAGDDVEALAYWHVTERKLWFDSNSGAVRLKTECSTRTVAFNERENGILFLWEPGVTKPGGPDQLGTVCGRVYGADRIKDLDEGKLQMEILCEAEVDDFAADPQRAVFIAPRPGDPYIFDIDKQKRDTDPNLVCDR